VSGQISNKFSKCPNLQTLILSNNNITGAFPKSFGEDNPNLEIINLSNNQISGSLPTVVGRLSKLSYLQINENVLSGQISAESLSTLFGLRRLELQGNLFTGPFPKAGYGLPDLEILRIDNTGFEGTIGSDIMQMNNLRELDMSRSLMGGPIPAELYRLQNLTSLKLNEANFIGEVSDDVRFLNQTLEYLYLYNNNLSGPMPVDGFGALTNLQELQLYGTDLTGVIPADSDLCGLVFSSQVQYIRTACDLVTCECCAKCVPL
jgi:Leucine-rich repeat (LRR) protein